MSTLSIILLVIGVLIYSVFGTMAFISSVFTETKYGLLKSIFWPIYVIGCIVIFYFLELLDFLKTYYRGR
jgi:uncharacterized membrane protein YdbT with pleckstrin-like domain